MSDGAKVRIGHATWARQEAASARPLADEGSGSKRLVTDITRQHIDPKLHRISTDPDQYVGSPHFKELVRIFAAGDVPSLENMMREGEYFNTTEVTLPIMQNPAIRGALAAAVQEESKGRVKLVQTHAGDVGDEKIVGDAVHMAIERPFGRIPFTVHELGIEPHRRGGR
ncbi:MAG: hypothetical protein ACAI38_13830 [Myxococcota bacterium]|nr:hypothetical protein [Myxococcota bacterium]